MSLLDRVRSCTVWTPELYTPFVVEGRVVGQLGQSFGQWLLATFKTDFEQRGGAIWLKPALATVGERSQALAQVVTQGAQEGRFKASGQLLPLVRYWGDSALAHVDSGALPSFGGRVFGIGVVGYELKPAGTTVWLSRPKTATSDASGKSDVKLDVTIDVTVPGGATLAQTLADQAAGLAGISGQNLGLYAKWTSLVSYIHPLPGERLANEAWFVVDYGPARGFKPFDQGQRVTYDQMAMDQVLATLRETEDFASRAALILLDFALRQSFVVPGLQSDYQQLIQSLRLSREEESRYWSLPAGG
ncbi:protein of unknown function [Tistlia consotensis]|uniref:DUF4743 domain-containing protein n=1 Tax=Tistlia consotensis USBA 355 TaxID=560819 RepID=A0A1Y6BAJ5_9PROT|nr:DUF4743 domain-containing protein [Tistlia consotensis]SME97893.1 protein of unknown function [Tistlia consotensis USBA 355]SNR57264.1 protein of unknown function [Tistlia consotensis]